MPQSKKSTPKKSMPKKSAAKKPSSKTARTGSLTDKELDYATGGQLRTSGRT